MAKVIGPLFSMGASGSFGGIIFDRRGFAYMRQSYHDPKTANQGNYRQAMTVAQKCVKICGPATRQLLKATTTTRTWHGYLMKHIIGPNHANYTQHLQNYTDPAVDQAGWEAAASSAGLQPITIGYANETQVSPGAQLFSLASTLFSLGLYTAVGQPNDHAPAWKESIIS